MIRVLDSLPANVFGYAIIGDLEASDYRILSPALKQAASVLRGGVNILVDVTQAQGLGTKALWEEAKLQWELAGNVNRVAVVGPPLWTEPFITIAGMIRIGIETETFGADQREEAAAWLAGVISFQ